MRNIDFLSEYPRIYIFEKEVNKTNFGGILFLLYIITMLIISASYILLFCLNDKYKIEYASINNQTLSQDSNELDNNPDLNPTLDFKMMVDGQTMYKNFRVALLKNNKMQIEEFSLVNGNKMSLSINSSVSKFSAILVYFCGNDSSCQKNPEKDSIDYNTNIDLEFVTPAKKIDHQNKLKPISDGYELLYTSYPTTTFDSHILYIYNWKVIKGIFIRKKKDLDYYLIRYLVIKMNISRAITNQKKKYWNQIL